MTPIVLILLVAVFQAGELSVAHTVLFCPAEVAVVVNVVVLVVVVTVVVVVTLVPLLLTL